MIGDRRPRVKYIISVVVKSFIIFHVARAIGMRVSRRIVRPITTGHLPQTVIIMLLRLVYNLRLACYSSSGRTFRKDD